MYQLRIVVVCITLGIVSLVNCVTVSVASGGQTPSESHGATGEVVNKRLNALASELALVEAGMTAVDKRLAETGATPTQGSSGPVGVDEFCQRITAVSAAADRKLKFDLLSETDREQAAKAVSAELGQEADKGKLALRRKALDTKQASIWAQIAWGALESRDIDTNPLYLYRLKVASTGEADASSGQANTLKRMVLDAGVKAVRTINAALNAGSDLLSVSSNESTGLDLAKAISGTTAQSKDALAALQTMAIVARDTEASGLTDGDKSSIQALRLAADRLKESMESASEAQSRIERADDEISRSVNGRQFQQDLIDTFDAASQLDQKLVALSKEWKAEVDQANKLGPVLSEKVVKKPRPAVEKPKVQRDPKPEAIEEVFPQGSTWTGRDCWSKGGTRGTVVKVDGPRATMRYENDIGMFEITFEIRRDHVVLLTLDGVGLQNDKNVFADHFNIKVSAPFNAAARSGELILTGTMDGARPQKRKQWANEKVKLELKRDASNATTTGK